jgi:hypothetical protein
MALHRPSRKSVEILEEVSNAYTMLHPPNPNDSEAYLQVYGKCHLETKEDIRTIQQRLNALENADVVLPAPSPIESLDDADQPSHTSSIESIRNELRERDERIQEFEQVTTRQLEDIEGSVTIVKESVEELDNKIDEVDVDFVDRMNQLERNMDGRFHDLGKDVEERFNNVNSRFDATDRRFDELEKNTDRRFDELEKNTDRRFDELEKNTDRRFDNVDERFDQFQLSVQSQFKNMQALHKNGNADRLYVTVEPIGVEYQDSRGYTYYRLPPGPPQPVKYYWKLHRSRHYNKLLALHEFYQIPYTDWSTNDDSSDDDDNGDPPWHPLSLEAAIAKFPIQAVRALFGRLGLVYSKFEEQDEKLQALDQGSGKTAKKRASKQALPLGTPRSKVRRQSPSAGSTTEPPTSSTESRDSVALVGYD